MLICSAVVLTFDVLKTKAKAMQTRVTKLEGEGGEGDADNTDDEDDADNADNAVSVHVCCWLSVSYKFVYHYDDHDALQ